MKTELCPDPQSLKNFLLGRVVGSNRDVLQEHLLHCDRCVAIAHSLPQTDELTELTRGANPIQNEDSDVIAALIDRIKLARFEAETVRVDETLPLIASGPQSLLTETSLQGLSFLKPPEQPDEIGRLGDYRVIQVIGSGGMGMVLRAEDIRLRRQVAIKTMKPSIAESVDAKRRFLREAQATAALEHDNIVPIYQVGEDNGVPFIAMQYLKGESLKTRLDRLGKLPTAEIVRIGKEVASGLAAAHEHGLIHRDIKPDNIWIEDKTNRAKILDFGLVSAATDDDGLTHSGTVLGTPRYMSPEQALAQPVDHRADLFSLGSVLYHAATGKPPFIANGFTATLIAVANTPPKPLRESASQLPASVASLIMQMLEKKPEQRPQTAGEVAERFTGFEQKLRVNRAKQPTDESLYKTSHDRNVLVAKAVPPAKPPRYRGMMIAAAGGFAALVLGVIIITITNKDGIETVIRVPSNTATEIDAQPGSKVSIREDSDGGVAAKVAQPNTSSTVIENPVRDGDRVPTGPIVSVAPIVPLDLTPAEPLGTWEMGPEPPWFAQDFHTYSLKDAAVLPGIIDRPAIIPGIKRWNVDTVWPRGRPKKIAYSPDGQWIGLLDMNLAIYDAKTLKQYCVLPGFTRQIGASDFVWHPDSHRVLIAADHDGSISRIFDIEGQLLHEESVPGGARAVAWHRKSRKIAKGITRPSQNGSCIEILDEDHHLLKTLPEDTAGDELGVVGGGYLAWSSDGESVIALHFDGKLRHWNLQTSAAEIIDEIEGSHQLGCSLDWHESGWLTVSNRKEIRVYSPDLKLDHAFPASGLYVRWHPDGKYLLFSDEGLRVWDRVQRKQVASNQARFGGDLFDWSPDGKELATGSEVQSLIVSPANLKTPRLQSPTDVMKNMAQLAWSPDGNLLASAQLNSKPPQFWSAGGNAIRVFQESSARATNSLAWSTDGNELFGINQSGNLWSTTVDGNSRDLFQSSDLWSFRVANSPDGQTIVAGRKTGRIQILSRDGKEIKEVVTGGNQFPFVAWCHATNQIAVCEAEQPLKFLEPENNWNLRVVDDTILRDLSQQPTWSPDGKLLSINTQISFDTSTNSIVPRPFALAWRPDSQRFISGINGWLATYRANAATLVRRGQQGLIIGDASWHPRGHLFAIATEQSRFTVWNESNYQPHWHGVLLPDNKSVTFSAAGEVLDGNPEQIDQFLVYYLDRGDGRIETLTPAEFRMLPIATSLTPLR